MDFSLLAIEKSVTFFCLVQLTEIIAPLSGRGQRVSSKRHFEIVLPVFELLFQEPDLEATKFNSFSVSTVFGSGSKGLLFTLLLMLCHTQTAEPKRRKFMHLALNIEWDLN